MDGVFKIRKKILLYFILILPFIIPDIVTRTEMGGVIVQGWKIISGIWTIYKLFISKRISTFPVIISIFYGIIIINGLFHGKMIISNLTGLVLIWMVYYMTFLKENRQYFYKVYLNLMKILIYGNFVSMVLFPNGLYSSSVYSNNWLLGYKNTFVLHIIPVLTIMAVSYLEYGKKFDWQLYLLTVVSFISMLWSQSITGAICILIYVIGLILIRYNKFPKKIGFANSFIIYIVIDLLLVSERLLLQFGDFITNVLNKSVTLTGRTAIWNSAILQIRKHWILGYGFISSDAFGFDFRISHAHNLLLNYWLLGGIGCLLVLMIAFVYLDSKKRDNNNSAVEVTIIMLITIFVMGFSESLLLAGNFVFAVLVLMSNLLLKVRT